MAQHSKNHEKEKGSSFGKGYKSSPFKGLGKGSNPSKGKWRSYYVEDDDKQESRESASQSFGGYEDITDDHTVYRAGTAELCADEYDPIHVAYQAMNDERLDEEDPEAIEHAADILQAESEAYHAQLHAQSPGHYGFWSKGHGRQFQVQGSLSVEEKRQRVQALKLKSSCRQCGQVGHWANDPIWPKGFGKGKRKRIHSVDYQYGLHQGTNPTREKDLNPSSAPFTSP